MQKNKKKNYIYIIDDVEDNAALLTHYLQSEDYDVEILLNGTLAMEALERDFKKNNLPDLIFVDLFMPGMNGLDVIKHIRANEKLGYIPIIMLTAQADTKTKITGLEVGADDFLTKPINRSELLARVNSLLRLKQSYDEKTNLLKQVQSAYEQLNAAQTIIITVEKHKSQMAAMLTTAAGICHEMSQPLTSALITLQLMRQNNPRPIEEDISTVEKSLLQAREILDKLRALTRYETKTYLGDEVILDIDRSSENSNATIRETPD